MSVCMLIWPNLTQCSCKDRCGFNARNWSYLCPSVPICEQKKENWLTDGNRWTQIRRILPLTHDWNIARHGMNP